MCGKISIKRVNKAMVMGCLVSGAPVSRVTPFKYAFTWNDLHGSRHPMTLCQLAIAQTYECIVDGAFLFSDRYEMKSATSSDEAGPTFTGGSHDALNCSKLLFPTSNIWSVLGAQAFFIILLPSCLLCWQSFGRWGI